MVNSGAPLQLVTTFNEWGEGSQFEGATQYQSASGFGAYADVLHRVLGGPVPTPTPTPTATPLPTPTPAPGPTFSFVITIGGFTCTINVVNGVVSGSCH